MRITTFLLLSSFYLNAWADPVMCGDNGRQHADLLTPDQWQAVRDEKSGGDPLLAEAVALEQAKASDSSIHVIASAPKISWDLARKLILLGAIRIIIQHHDRSVLLITRSHKAMFAFEARLDEVWDVVSTVDPCGVYTIKITE